MRVRRQRASIRRAASPFASLSAVSAPPIATPPPAAAASAASSPSIITIVARPVAAHAPSWKIACRNVNDERPISAMPVPISTSPGQCSSFRKLMSSRASTEVVARRAQRIARLAQQRDAPGLEERREHRVVDVPLRIEVAEPDDVVGPAGKLTRVRGKTRAGLAAAIPGSFTAQFSMYPTTCAEFIQTSKQHAADACFLFPRRRSAARQSPIPKQCRVPQGRRHSCCADQDRSDQDRRSHHRRGPGGAVRGVRARPARHEVRTCRHPRQARRPVRRALSREADLRHSRHSLHHRRRA